MCYFSTLFYRLGILYINIRLMSERNVSVKIEEGGTKRSLGSSDELGPYSQIAVSPANRHPRNQTETPAVVRFDNIEDYYVFVVFQTTDEKKIPALVTNKENSQTISISFVDMMTIKVVNILTEDELKRIERVYGLDKAFEKHALHNKIDDKVLKDI